MAYKYEIDVEIVETRKRTLSIPANSEKEALEKAEFWYEEYVNLMDDCTDIECKIDIK